jgi:hypothetical protein
VGTTETLTFTPNNPSARAEIESFDFFGYYNSNERFTYNVSVVSGTNVVNGPTTYTFLSDGTENHPVTINYTGAPGQTLQLRLARVASTLGAGEREGNEYDNSVDNIAFAQTPATTFPAGPQVVSVSPVDGTSGLPATSIPPYAATIADGTLTAAAPFQLTLDGSLVSPPASVTALGGGLTSVSYPGAAPVLLASGLHLFTLSYADNLGGMYTNQVVFSTIYATLPTTYALPPGSGEVEGFTWLTVSAFSQVTNSLDSTVERAVEQLDGTLINPATSLPYTNEAALGPNADGSYNMDTILNFNDDGSGEGDFPTNQTQFPGLTTLGDQWFSGEGLLYLDLSPGYYRFGVNSDDGFEVNALPPQGVSGVPITLGIFDNGRGAADTLFDFLVPTSGIYPFQVIYFQSTHNSEIGFFSVTNLATGGSILINDTNYPNAIISYRSLAPHFTSIAQSGTNIVLNWAYGAPLFQVQQKTNLTDALWSNIGSPTSNSTAIIPIQPGARFFRVSGQ